MGQQLADTKVLEATSKKVDNLNRLSMNYGTTNLNLFKSCENLKALSINYNSIALEHFTEHLVLKNLEEFAFDGNLNERHLDMLLQNANGNIRILCLFNCYLKEKEFIIFNSICNHCPRLTRLLIWITEETIEYIFKIFDACRNLQKLALFDHKASEFNVDDWMLYFPVHSPPSLQYFKL